MRIPLSLRLAAVLAVCVVSACGVQAQLGSMTIVSAALTVDTKTVIPGANLKPGSYTIRVIDNLKDRYIIGVDDTSSKEIATFIGLKEAGFSGSGTPGAIAYAHAPGKSAALRGFSFANGLSLEFVYPKATAVELAKLNTSSVPAIDPESEGIPPDPKLSVEDRKVVTLWMLTSTRVGQGQGAPAIEAKRFQAQENTELAENMPPPSPKGAQTATPVQTDSASAPHLAPESVAKTKSRVVAQKLPQTASELPLVLLLSGGLLLVGIGFRVRRRVSSNL